MSCMKNELPRRLAATAVLLFAAGVLLCLDGATLIRFNEVDIIRLYGEPVFASRTWAGPVSQGQGPLPEPRKNSFPPPPPIPSDGAGRYFIVTFEGEIIGTSMSVQIGQGVTESRTLIDLTKIDGSMAMEFHSREERGLNGRITSYSSRSTTTAGILETSFTLTAGTLTARAKLPQGTERSSTQRAGEADFRVLDNNIYDQVAAIVEKWAPECDSTRHLRVFIPSFMKFKDLRMVREGEQVFSLTIGSQLILAKMRGESVESLDFPFQMFTARSCGAGEFSSASLLLSAMGKIDIVDSVSPGPARFTVTASIPTDAATGLDLISTPWYRHMGRVSGGIVSGTWIRNDSPPGAKPDDIPPDSGEGPESAGNQKSHQDYPRLSLEKISTGLIRTAALIPSEDRQGLTSLSATVSAETKKILETAGRPARRVFGLALAGREGSPSSLVPVSWIETRLPADLGSSESWTPVDPMLNLHPGRYIRLGLGQATVAPGSFNPTWDRHDSAPGEGTAFPEGPESGRFILRLEGSENVGVAAYDMKKIVDFTKGYKTLSAAASTFFAFGNLEARKRKGGIDSYNYTFVARTVTEYDQATGFRSLTASSKSSQGEGSHSLSRSDGCLEAVTRSKDKQIFKGSRKGDWAILEPWNLSHWRKLFCETVAAYPRKSHHRVRALNPFSTGKGFAVYVDLFLTMDAGRITVKAPLYGMTFDLDPQTLRILGFSDSKTRIVGIPVDEATYRGSASELGAKAKFDVVGFDLR